MTPSLEGEPIEDVGYQLIQTWRPGQKGKDNGVVLVIATGERRIRIETGKGVGGDLTDLQSNDIIRRRIGPLMRENRVHDAILAGVDGISEALSGAGTTRRPAGAQRPADWTAAASGRPAPLLRPVLLGVHPLRRRDAAPPVEPAPASPDVLGRPALHRRWRLGRRGGGGGGWGGGDGGGGGSGFGGGGGGEGGGGGSSDSY